MPQVSCLGTQASLPRRVSCLAPILLSRPSRIPLNSVCGALMPCFRPAVFSSWIATPSHLPHTCLQVSFKRPLLCCHFLGTLPPRPVPACLRVDQACCGFVRVCVTVSPASEPLEGMAQ